MSTVPPRIVTARRLAGALLVLSAMVTVIVLVILASGSSSRSTSAVTVTGTSSKHTFVVASVSVGDSR